MTLEQFVERVIAREQGGYASFQIEAGHDEERIVVWIRTERGVDLFIVLSVSTNPQGLRGSACVGAARMQREMGRDGLQHIAALIAPGRRADEIEGSLDQEGGAFPAEP
jgi:hypothetical protein